MMSNQESISTYTAFLNTLSVPARVLICGEREFVTPWVALDVVRSLPVNALIIEGCARGADRLADWAGTRLGRAVEHHPADWDRLGRKAGMVRNIEMLDRDPHLVIALYNSDLDRSRGTSHTVMNALIRGILVVGVNKEGVAQRLTDPGEQRNRSRAWREFVAQSPRAFHTRHGI